MLVFSNVDLEAAEKFARNDPYVKNGVVKNWRVRKWTTVIGGRFRSSLKSDLVTTSQLFTGFNLSRGPFYF